VEYNFFIILVDVSAIQALAKIFFRLYMDMLEDNFAAVPNYFFNSFLH